MNFLLKIRSYDLDPDDGYGGRLILPYETYYTNDNKSLPHVHSTVQPYNSKTSTAKPINNDYNYKPIPISGFEPVSFGPYEISVTTQDTHQHLTETTQHVPYHRNRSMVEIKPVTLSSFIPITTVKPLHEILHNMNKTSLQLLLTKLKENNYLPKTFTMNKLDSSLRTLAKALGDLKKAQKPVESYEHSPSNLGPHSSKLQPVKTNYEIGKTIRPIKSNACKQFIAGNSKFAEHK